MVRKPDPYNSGATLGLVRCSGVIIRSTLRHHDTFEIQPVAMKGQEQHIRKSRGEVLMQSLYILPRRRVERRPDLREGHCSVDQLRFHDSISGEVRPDGGGLGPLAGSLQRSSRRRVVMEEGVREPGHGLCFEGTQPPSVQLAGRRRFVERFGPSGVFLGPVTPPQLPRLTGEVEGDCLAEV